MTWDIAAGVIIGGVILRLIGAVFKRQGVGNEVSRDSPEYQEGKRLLIFDSLLTLIGIVLAAWIIFFKAKFR